jgi:hypothetical protein
MQSSEQKWRQAEKTSEANPKNLKPANNNTKKER